MYRSCGFQSNLKVQISLARAVTEKINNLCSAVRSIIEDQGSA